MILRDKQPDGQLVKSDPWWARALLSCVEANLNLRYEFMNDPHFHELVTRARIEIHEYDRS